MKITIETFLNVGRKIIPRPIFKFSQPIYHYLLAFLAALFYGFPSKKIKVIGITGTKGKSTTVYILSKIFDEAGIKNSASSSIEFKIGEKIFSNSLKMTTPGRFTIQKFLRESVNSNCEIAILEVTSEGIKQFRHRFINFDADIFTNLYPEHIESHGSFEKYRQAKLDLFKRTNNIHIINADNENAKYFLDISAKKKIIYSLKNWPANIKLKLVGEFNKYNALAALTVAKQYNIDSPTIKKALEKIEFIPGRMEFIEKGQDFQIVVDYAHTPESLEQVYKTLGKPKFQKPNSKLICVLGAAGGGRDKWKRPVMGEIAGRYCQEIILTNEDPYDEDPNEIIAQIERGLIKTEYFKENYQKILDRRQAIKTALQLAKKSDTVIFTGKGSETKIMLKNTFIPWNEKKIVMEELSKII